MKGALKQSGYKEREVTPKKKGHKGERKKERKKALGNKQASSKQQTPQ